MNPQAMIQLGVTRAGAVDIELVDDLDELAESTKCSCNAGDDNPF
ncbi:hypothetical protein GCM10009759_15250 [Kitasatospora saccharophila]|uniref:Uncharacterized protein n=1 Tax=Kitasatospora saccharophila TaxID=407973 RepID=A0ABN2WGA1_9ACTN